MSTVRSTIVTGESLPDAVESDQLELVHIRYSFIVGFGVFIVLFPFYFSKRSLFDSAAARKIIRIMRFFVLVEIALVGILYFFYFENGSPIEINEQLAYGNGENWLYSYARPTAALIFVGFGLFSEMHPAIRWLCLIGCAVEIMGDAFAAVQVRDYYRQVIYLYANKCILNT